MKTRFLIIIGLIIAVVISITLISVVYNQEIKLATGMMSSDEKPQPVFVGVPFSDDEWLTETEIPLGTSDESLKSKTYITNCDETLHKDELPNLTIENSTHNYDMQYCKWELKYPDLTLINDNNLMNDYPYCAELFDTLFDYYESIRDNCGMTRYNEDGTPRAICEPAPAGAGVPRDINMIKSGCTNHYADWAFQTKHNDDVFYLFDREINVKIHSNLDEQIKIIDKLCNDNDYRIVEPNIKFRNNTNWIDTDNCALNIKGAGVVLTRTHVEN